MDWSKILPEISFRTSRSSGAGGQHVNKTETRVEVLFDLYASDGLTEEEKALISERLRHRMTDDGLLIFKSQKSRSQVENKTLAIDNLRHHLIKALTPVKRRVKTKPSAGSVEERLEAKKRASEKKESRQKPRL